MLERYYYEDSFSKFLSQSENEILGIIVKDNSFDSNSLQIEAWLDEIAIMKDVVKNFAEGRIAFEYSIPRLGKRADVVLVFHGIIFVLEFKVGEKAYLISDSEQVWDYALDLKNFHEASHDKIIVPILIATEANERSYKYVQCQYDDNVYEPICSNKDSLSSIIKIILEKNKKDCHDNLLDWANSRYSPTPTIIQAASALFNNQNVADITRTEASAENLIIIF